MSKQELRGLKSLLKRIKDREVMVLPSDKSGKLTVVGWDIYIQNMMKIVGNDVNVGWHEVGPAQDRMNGHCSMWLKMTDMGSDWDQAQRIREALLRYGQCVPPLYGLVKDHKPEGSYAPMFGPPYRPVCGASFGPNAAMSNVISEYIDVLADEMIKGCEIRATEELSYHFEATNVRLQSSETTQGTFFNAGGRTGGLTIGSLDVVSMFPNLKAIPVSKMAGQAVLESSVEFAGLDYQMVGIYLALNYPRHELSKLGLSDLIPIRKVKPGGRSKITISSVECRSPNLAKEKWYFSPKIPNCKEKRLMLSKAVEVGVRECFRNHLYTFNGKVYRQTEGGPIGLRLSMAISRLVMAMWDKMLMDKGSNTGWLIHLLKRYVDDCTAVLETLKLGVRWSEMQGLSYNSVWEEEDKSSGLSDDQRTMREFQKMANTILDFIQVTYDTCTDNVSGRLPILDLQCWVNDRVIFHMYYEKPMASRYFIKEASAMSSNTKWSSLSQEIIRRMKNTSWRVPHTVREDILTDCMRKLQRSGYPELFRRDCLIKGLEGYTKMVKAEASGLGPVNRPRGKRPQKQKKRLKRIRDKGEWYKKPKCSFVPDLGSKQSKTPNSYFVKQSSDKAKKVAGSQTKSQSKWEYESVLFVPQTPGGELAAALRAYEKKRGSLRRIRVVERAGISLKDKLFSSNPWSKDGCERVDCFPCKYGSGEGGVCRRENLTYTMTCTTCSASGVKKVYYGETSRTLYQRGKEHWSDYLSESDKSSLHKHSSSAHPDCKPEWKIKVYNYHQKPLRRQVEEGVLINNANGNELLNSKSEITRGGKIPRLVVMVGDKESGNSNHDSFSDVDLIVHCPVSETNRRTSAKTVSTKRQGEKSLKQTLIQPMLKKLKLDEDVSKRKRLPSQYDNVEDDSNEEFFFSNDYSNDIHSLMFDKYGRGKVARYDVDVDGMEKCGADGEVVVVGQDLDLLSSQSLIRSQDNHTTTTPDATGEMVVVDLSVGHHATMAPVPSGLLVNDGGRGVQPLLPSVDYGNVQTAIATSVLPRVNCWKGGRPDLAEQQHQSLPLLPSVDYGNVQTAIATSVLPRVSCWKGGRSHLVEHESLPVLPSVDFGNVQTAVATSVLPRVSCWKGGTSHSSGDIHASHNVNDGGHGVQQSTPLQLAEHQSLDIEVGVVVGESNTDEWRGVDSDSENVKKKEEERKPGSTRKKNTLATASKVVKNENSKSQQDVKPEPSVAQAINKHTSKIQASMQTPRRVAQARNRSKIKNIQQIQGQSKISRFLIPIPSKLSAATKTKPVSPGKLSQWNSLGTSGDLASQGNQKSSHSNSVAQSVHNIHSEKGHSVAETSKC